MRKILLAYEFARNRVTTSQGGGDDFKYNDLVIGGDNFNTNCLVKISINQ